MFLFPTDATGKITAWNFALSNSYIYPDLSESDPPGGINGQGIETFMPGDFMNSSDRLYNHTFTDALSAPRGNGWTQYTKVTTDGGKTFEFVTLKGLGLGNGK